MKPIIDLTRNELKKLFFSPVAILILLIFCFYSASGFSRVFEALLRNQNAGYPPNSATHLVYASNLYGFYKTLLNYLYLFFPLLTMNIFSRDQGSGAISLLLSSPLSNRQIVLGKYFSLVIFSLVLIVVISLVSFYGYFKIENADPAYVFCGLLGLFLLCCTYSAIGLFMSSITNHPIVAAIGTLIVLFILNMVGDLWQEYPFIRDITYWLSLNGKVIPFIEGFIPSEDLIYFLALITFFVSLTILRLRTKREKRSRLQNILRYSFLVFSLCIIAYASSRPQLKKYADLTREKNNTLSEESQRVVSKLKGALTLTAYSNMLDATGQAALPRYYKKDVELFENYIRFKPEIKMNYVYYHKHLPGSFLHKKFPNLSEKEVLDTFRIIANLDFDILPYSAIQKEIDLSGENYRFVRLIERENGQKTFLRFYEDAKRYPDEAQITAALKRLADTLPKVGFVTGHGERSNAVDNDRGYSLMAQEKTFRYALLNNGFDFEEVRLSQPVPPHISILVIADPRQPYRAEELQHYQEYLDRGGNLIIACEPDKQAFMVPITEPLGISILPGQLAAESKSSLPELLSLKPFHEKRWDTALLKDLARRELTLMLNGASALVADSTKGFTVMPLFATDSSVWNEIETTDFRNDSVRFNPQAGEKKQPWQTVLALERKRNGKTQKILVTGDADWISNAEVTMSRKKFRSANFSFANGVYYWLSDHSVPINTKHPDPIDNKLLTSLNVWGKIKIFYLWVLPIALLASGAFILIRRKGR